MYNYYISYIPIPPLGTFQYTVKPNDTLYKIANRFNTTISNILIFNWIPNPNYLIPGQVLTIPESAPESIIYTVKPGDTLYSIAQENNSSVKNIIRFNYIRNPNIIYPGQQLVVPVSLR